MILTARRQQRILAEIRRGLRRSDPRLVARFTMFTRLNRNEEMPAAERMRFWPLRWAVSAFARPPGTLSRRLAAVVFIPAMAAVLISLPFILSHGQVAVNCARAATAPARAQPRAFSPPGWTVPSCHPGSLIRVWARGGLPTAAGSGVPGRHPLTGTARSHMFISLTTGTTPASVTTTGCGRR